METSPITRGRIALLMFTMIMIVYMLCTQEPEYTTKVKMNDIWQVKFENTMKEKRKQTSLKKMYENSKLAQAKAKEYCHLKIEEIKERERQEQIRQEQLKRQQRRITYSAPLSEEEAKAQIAQRESGGDYNAISGSGKYIGKYQLDRNYLNGDYSPENQERIANEYVMSRYGSWANARAHQRQYGWY